MIMSTKKSNTRAAQGSGTIRERKDGRWEARYTIGRGTNGKQIQRSVYGSSEKEVLEKLQRIQVDITDNLYVEPSKLTVGQWLDIWVDVYTGKIKETTKKQYKHYIDKHIKRVLGNIPLQKLDPLKIQRFYNELEKSGRILQKGQKKEAPAGLSAKTIRNIHAILHKALKKAVLLKYLKNNPTDKDVCEPPDVEKKEMKILQGDEIGVFLNAVESHRYKTLYLIMLFCALRRGEALGISWNDIDFIDKTILINRQVQRKDGQLCLVPIKNNKQRRISPPETIFNLLSELRIEQMKKKELAGAIWSESGLVFTNGIGKPLDGDVIYKAYKKLLKDSGLPDIRIHDLRHTAATLMLQNGDSVKTVQNTLGHFSAGFTLDTYGHVTEKMNRDSADRMEALIQGFSKTA